MKSVSDVSKTWEGQIIDGKFPLRRWLGGSGHSAVFLTDWSGHESQNAAIKLIPANVPDLESQRTRLELSAGLSHPHLIRVFQSGYCVLHNVFYILMEYADEDLSQVLPQRALTPAETSEMLPFVLDALSYIHRRGLVHGHIKPSNIMGVANQLKVSSDGLYRTHTKNGVAVDPSVYDAPEAAAGDISPAMDVWSVGVTLVAALTQRPPVWGGAEQTEPILPDTIPQPFRDIATACLKQIPQQRTSIDDIVSRLRRPAATVQPEVAKSQASLAKGRIAALIVIGLALVALLVGYRVSNRHPVAPLPPATEHKEQAANNAPASPAPVVPTSKANPSRAESRGAVLKQVLPEVPRSARNTIHGKIKVNVRVAVDAEGDVAAAKLVTAGPSQYFARLALKAARDWKFTPPQTGGQNAASNWMLHFQFARSSTTVVPAQMTP